MVANMHGNEPVGRELIIHLAKYMVLANQQQKNDLNDDLMARAAKLLTTTDLWILPTLNPDGFAISKEGECHGRGRQNSNAIDLDRNFPRWNHISQSAHSTGFEKETQLLMNWTHTYPLVLSANMHDGAVLVNYPFDNYHDT